MRKGFLRHPEMLYRPWRVEEKGKPLEIIFRDHAMSDQIGFHYQRYPAEQAADDFMGKLEAIGRATADNAGQRPPLVSIILDGENCWEYYPNGGVEFLRGLYHRLARHSTIKPVRVHDFLSEHPATDKLGRICSPAVGSATTFGIWIGHPECNRAWDLLFEARSVLVQRAGGEDENPPVNLARAWEELYIAEGSDWFWWFGDSHSSSPGRLFDQLFRKHLQNVYTLLGEEPPAELLKPISPDRRQERLYTQPTGLVNVNIDGRETYFEWINAGVYTASAARGTMNMADSQRIEQLYFGFERERLLLRFDVRGSVCQRLADVDTLRIVFLEPAGFELLVTSPSAAKPTLQLFHNDVPVSAAGVEAAADIILEIAIPWRSLATATDAPLHFFAELIQDNQPLERIPHEAAIETSVPSPDYELMMWQA